MKAIETKNAPSAIGPYSQAIVTENYIFTSGQIPLDPATGKLTDGSIAEQTEQVIKNLAAVLAASGSNLNKVIKTTCFLKCIGDFSAFNEIYAKHFISNPARSCVEVSALPKGALVEIEAIALL